MLARTKISCLLLSGLLIFCSVPLVVASGSQDESTTTQTTETVTEEMAEGVDIIPVTTPDSRMARYQEAPELAAMVRQGSLPPGEQRLPDLPPVEIAFEEVGEYGGILRHTEFLYTNFRSITRYMDEGLIDVSVPRGHHRYPNLAESLEVNSDNTVYTIRLRKGVKWSDGHEFTAEDVLFKWFDVLLYSPDPEVKSEDLVRPEWKVAGVPAEITSPDDYTIVVEFAEPFVNYHKNIGWNYLDPAPAHHLKQFHPKFNTNLGDATEAWQEFTTFYTTYLDVNRPTLGPWMPETVKEGEVMIMARNPYYWKVDEEGKQLPYADQLRIGYIKDAEVQKLQLAAGEFDWNAMSMPIDAVLFQQQDAGDYRMVVPPGFHSSWIFYRRKLGWISNALTNPAEPNDRKLAELLMDSEFLKALQLGIDNEQMMKAYTTPELFDFRADLVGRPRLDHAKPIGQLDDPRVDKMWEYLEEWMRFDLEEANQILDDLGLKVGADGFRQYAEGGRIEIDMGIVSDWDIAEMHVQQCRNWERDLNIKTFCIERAWSEAVQTWWIGEDIPLVSARSGHWFWVTDALFPYALYQYSIVDWIASGGEQGVEPPPAYRDRLIKLQELADESARTADQDRRTELAIQATELMVYDGLDGTELTFGGAKFFHYVNNRVKNNPEGYPPWGIRRWVRMEQWWIDE